MKFYAYCYSIFRKQKDTAEVCCKVIWNNLLHFLIAYFLLFQIVMQAGLLREGLCSVQDESAGQFFFSSTWTPKI